MGHVVGDIYSEVGFGGHFPHFWPQNKPILASLAVFWKTLRAALRIPVYDWKMPILQSGELQIKQNLMSKIKPAKLTTKMQLIDLWTPVFSYKILFLAQIHNTSLKLVPTVNFQPNSKNSFIWIIHEQTVYRNLNCSCVSLQLESLTQGLIERGHAIPIVYRL